MDAAVDSSEHITSNFYEQGQNMESAIIGKYIVSALVFSAIGIAVLIVAMVIFDKLTPGHLWKEIVEEKNMALALTCSAAIIAIGQIIASAIHG